LKEEFGILATPIRKTRHGISDDVKQLVLDVYEDDVISGEVLEDFGTGYWVPGHNCIREVFRLSFSWKLS